MTLSHYMHLTSQDTRMVLVKLCVPRNRSTRVGSFELDHALCKLICCEKALSKHINIEALLIKCIIISIINRSSQSRCYCLCNKVIQGMYIHNFCLYLYMPALLFDRRNRRNRRNRRPYHFSKEHKYKILSKCQHMMFSHFFYINCLTELFL